MSDRYFSIHAYLFFDSISEKGSLEVTRVDSHRPPRVIYRSDFRGVPSIEQIDEMLAHQRQMTLFASNRIGHVQQTLW